MVLAIRIGGNGMFIAPDTAGSTRIGATAVGNSATLGGFEDGHPLAVRPSVVLGGRVFQHGVIGRDATGCGGWGCGSGPAIDPGRVGWTSSGCKQALASREQSR